MTSNTAADRPLDILLSTQQTFENAQNASMQNDATTTSYLENITLQYFITANNQDWDNPIMTQFLSPNIRSDIQAAGYIACGIAEHTELVRQTVSTGRYKITPISATAQLSDASDLTTDPHLRKRRLGRQMKHACVWVLFKVKNLVDGIERESVGLFEYKRQKGGMWLMVHYTALSCTQPLPDDCPYTPSC